MRALPATLGASGSLVAGGVGMLLVLSASIGLKGWPAGRIAVQTEPLQVHRPPAAGAAKAGTRDTAAQPQATVSRALVLGARPAARPDVRRRRATATRPRPVTRPVTRRPQSPAQRPATNAVGHAVQQTTAGTPVAPVGQTVGALVGSTGATVGATVSGLLGHRAATP